jgi:hypothetical protein
LAAFPAALMKYTELPPRAVTTDDNFWKAVGLIAGARNFANQNIKFGKHRSRGQDGDVRTEIMGAWGEIATWMWADESKVSVRPPEIVSLSGPSKDVDFRASLDGEDAGLESKAWSAVRVDGSDSGAHSTMNINVVGHERSKGRGGDYYVFSFGLIGGAATIVGSPMEHDAISRWEQKDGKYGDPYYAKEIRTLVPEVVKGKNAFSMIKWIDGMKPSAKEREALIYHWRSAAGDVIESVMIACNASSSAEFLNAVRMIK